MYTQCPECLTVFKLGGAELAATLGSVRCGHCSAIFDALRTLTDQLPPEPIGTLDTHRVAVDWGDGTADDFVLLAEGVTSFSDVVHCYLDEPVGGGGPFTITAEVADDDQPLEPISATTSPS